MTAPEASRPELKERVAGDTTDAALAWLDGRGEERPFFLWVHYQDPHGPYTPPAEFLRASEAENGERELSVGDDERGHGALPRYQVIDEERRPSAYRARYEAEIRYFDRELGRLVSGLERRGILAHALLVFTADHGESLGEHGYYFSHGQHLHQELVRVPLLVRPPGGAREPRRISAPVSHLDLFPTVLSVFGLDPRPTRGIDLLSQALPAGRVLPQYLRGTWSATGERYRLLVERGGRRLFAYGEDPLEAHDLAAEHPELVETLIRGHRAFLEQVPLAPLAPAKAVLDAGAEQALDALGYGGEEAPEDEAPGKAAEKD
jgi:arylsulfatase